MIPSLTEHGLLPLGVHEASFEEVIQTFGVANTRRKEIADGLTRFLALVRGLQMFSFLFVDGSFCTDVDLPDDSDVVL